MIEKIKEFLNQFSFEPYIENKENFNELSKFVICGMGGSHLAGDFLKFLFPEIDLLIHRNYNLPLIKDLKERTIIVISFSGNTEEAISSFNEAISKGLNLIIISQNGKILELAKEKYIPYIKLPEDDIPPRLGVGYMLKALFHILHYEIDLENIKKEVNILEIEAKSQKLLEELNNRIPLIYSPEEIYPLAYFWKIAFNENSKELAFANSLPEICHNEIEFLENSQRLKKIKFFVIFLNAADLVDKRNIKRMEIISNILEENKIPFEIINFKGEDKFIITIKNILLALFTTYYHSINNNIDPVKVNLIDRIKKEIGK